MRKMCFTIVCISMLTITSILGAWCDYPHAGMDYLPSTTATIELDLGMGNETLVVKGPTTIARGNPYDPGDGRIKIDTEIVSMSLVGASAYGPMTVVESPAKESDGEVRQKTAGVDFPADSFFDVFIEIQTMMPPPLNVLYNDDPVFMSAVITTIPPWNTTYAGPPESVALKAQDGLIVGFIRHVSHETGPDPYPWYYKPAQTDYAPSGVPDFDQRQWGTYNWTDPWGTWSHCGPVAVANSLWWLDSELEPNPIQPPTINDGFPLVQAYGPWDDHDPQNVPPLVEHLARLMDTDGRRTGLVHSGTNVNDMEAGLAQYLSWTGVNPPGDANGDGIVDQTDADIVIAAYGSMPGMPRWNLAADLNQDNTVNTPDIAIVGANMGKTGLFYEHTVMQPDFQFIEEEVERCQDVVLLVGYYIFDELTGEWYREPGGHFVTVAGVDSTNIKLALSDPVQDAFESGLIPEGRIPVPHVHPPGGKPPYTTHNDAQCVSQDIYSVAQITPMWPPCPGGNWMLVNFASWRPAPPYFAVIESAVVTSPKHDLAVINVTTSKQGCLPAPTIGRNLTLQINVTVENQGGYVESFFDVWTELSLGLPPPITVGPAEVASLAPDETITLTFNWDTTGVAYGNYTVTGVVETVSGETDTGDNRLNDVYIFVTLPGDINADQFVNGKDGIMLGKAFYPTGIYTPNADINDDGYCNAKDAIILGKNFNQKWP
jgi:hypothetical protein